MTISPPVALLGVQVPRVASHPPFESSAADEAVELAESAGLVLDPWQIEVLRVAMGERADGGWAAYEVALLVARQNGKGVILEALELWALFLGGCRTVLHSAHEFKTAKEHYRRMRSLIEGAPHLLAKVKRRGGVVVGFRQSNEDTSIELVDGRRLRFLARAKSTGRGFTEVDLLVMDEAQILSDTTLDAMLFTQAAARNPQIVYTGTKPKPEDNAEVFTRLRDRGRAGDDPQLAWMEWSAGQESDADLDDHESWALANPSLGYHLSIQQVERERLAASSEGFAGERLSIWPDDEAGAAAVIDGAAWWDLAASPDEQARKPSRVGLAVSATDDRRFVHLCVAAEVDDVTVLRVYRTLRGPGEVTEAVSEVAERLGVTEVVVRGGGAAAPLIARIESAKAGARRVSVRTLAKQEYAKACGAFLDAATEGTLRHDGSKALAVAVGAAGRHEIGDGDLWSWVSTDEATHIAPLEGVTAAMHALSTATAKREPKAGKVVVLR